MGSSNRSQSGGRQRVSLPGERVLAAIIFGIFLLIAAGNIGKSVDALNKTLEAKEFADSNSYNSPSEITYAEKMYYTDAEAAEYLGITQQRVIALVTAGEIPEYIKTDAGYVISKTILDEWFENESYQSRVSNKISDTEQEEE
ncbi:MAG: helix-turn-helix domain-containing protein [Ruminococcus sp.]|jgi:excisionase family DNA binding protein|nr:helix-turn-helix domain-containing protein [Ruminococcus sp.]